MSVDYLHTGREFPWVVPIVEPEEVGYGTQYPLALTREQMHELVYRVRRIRTTLTVSLAASSQIDIPDPPSHAAASDSYSDGVSATVAQVASVETQLVLQSSISSIESQVNYGHVVTDEDPDTGATAATSLSASIMITFLESGAVQCGEFWYPSVNYSLLASAIASAGGASDSTIITSTPGGAESALGLEFFGEEFSLPIYSSHSHVDEEYITNTSSAEITSCVIEIQKWWPHDPGDGEPVWDEDTGTQLRDPFKIEMKEGVLVYYP